MSRLFLLSGERSRTYVGDAHPRPLVVTCSVAKVKRYYLRIFCSGLQSLSKYDNAVTATNAWPRFFLLFRNFPQIFHRGGDRSRKNPTVRPVYDTLLHGMVKPDSIRSATAGHIWEMYDACKTKFSKIGGTRQEIESNLNKLNDFPCPAK
jgi:hypothetical protein